MNKIRELRKQRKMTQKELAKHLQIADSTLSYWEMGKYEPDTDALMNLSRFFSVPIDYILGGDFSKWDINVAHSSNSEMCVSEPTVPYIKGSNLTNTTNPFQDVHSAFERAEFEDLTHDEMNLLAEYAMFIKSRRKVEKQTL